MKASEVTQEQRDEVIRLYKEHSVYAVVSRATGIPIGIIKQILDNQRILNGDKLEYFGEPPIESETYEHDFEQDLRFLREEVKINGCVLH